MEVRGFLGCAQRKGGLRALVVRGEGMEVCGVTSARMRPVYWVCYTLAKLVARVWFSYRVIGAERIPQSGPAILAMNHQSFADPPLAGIACRRAIFFLARKTLMASPFMGWLLPRLNVVPVERDGTDVSALKIVIGKIREGHCTVVFPEGTRTRDGELQAARPGLGLIVAKTGAPVVPMRVFGAFEAFPRTSKFPKRSPVTLVVGEPIRFPEERLKRASKEDYQRISKEVMEAIAALRIPQ